jgi:long-chain fatty acid transport protein
MRRSLAIAGAVVACAAVGAPLHAQGSSVDQQSACMSGRVGAGVASPCDDASGVYFSPAGLASQGSAISLGVTLINAGNTFTYDAGTQPLGSPQSVERDRETIPVPQAFMSFKVHPRVAAGIGVFAPYGLGLKWPVCSNETVNTAGCDQSQNFEGRYTGYDNSLRGIYIQPTLAFDAIPGRLQVGAGLDYVRGSIEVHQRADAPTIGLRGRDVADATLKGDGNGITANLGAILRLNHQASVGVRYLFPAKLDYDGDATFTQIATGTIFDPILAGQFAPGAAFSNQGISTTIKFPSQFVAGISYRPVEVFNLLFDYQRTGWSSFQAFDIDFENAPNRVLTLNYRDTNTFRLAGEFTYSDALSFRLGYRYNQAATPRATPFLPEGERNYYTAGIGWHVSHALSADFSYQYINQPDRRGAVRPDEPVTGVYDAFGQTFGFTLAYRFGSRPAGQ